MLSKSGGRKGFVMDIPKEYQNVKQKQFVDDGCLLFIPSKSVCVIQQLLGFDFESLCCII